VNLRQAAQMADELRRAAGGEVGGGEPPVALGERDAGGQRQGAEAAEAQGGAEVAVALLLARVAGHRLAEQVGLSGDVDQQVGVRRMVDLVRQDAQASEHLVAGERVSGRVSVRPLAVAQTAEQAMESGEGGAVVAADLERRGNEEELGPLREEGAGEAARQRLEIAVELAVGQAQMVAAGHSQDGSGQRRLLAPPGAVGRAIIAGTRAPAAVREEEDAHHGAGGGELRHDAAAPQHLVVVVRSDDQDARGINPLGRIGEIGELAQSMYPSARSRRSVSGSRARRFAAPEVSWIQRSRPAPRDNRPGHSAARRSPGPSPPPA